MNAEALLEACFLGIIASKQEADPDEDEEEQQAEEADNAKPSARRIVWDEANLTANDAERGVVYGTMTIDQADTPFLYYEEDGPSGGAANASVAIHSRCLQDLCAEAPPGTAPELVAAAAAVEKEPPGPHHLEVEDLQRLLGLIETDAQGSAVQDWPKYAEISDADFEDKSPCLAPRHSRSTHAPLALHFASSSLATPRNTRPCSA